MEVKMREEKDLLYDNPSSVMYKIINPVYWNLFSAQMPVAASPAASQA